MKGINEKQNSTRDKQSQTEMTISTKPDLMQERLFNVFNIFQGVPELTLERYQLPECYTNKTFSEKLWMMRFLLEDMRINFKQYLVEYDAA